MKKIITAIIAGIMAAACVFSMTACGNRNGGDGTSVSVDKDAMIKKKGLRRLDGQKPSRFTYLTRESEPSGLTTRQEISMRARVRK